MSLSDVDKGQADRLLIENAELKALLSELELALRDMVDPRSPSGPHVAEILSRRPAVSLNAIKAQEIYKASLFSRDWVATYGSLTCEAESTLDAVDAYADKLRSEEL